MDWILHNYINGDRLTRFGQERYAERHGMTNRCAHCYHVEDHEECCYCEHSGWTDEPTGWVQVGAEGTR